MSISIAMATYNGGRFLEAQLESFARQTRLPDELIVSDDGSTDNTEEIVKRFAYKAPFEVRFARNAERLGFNGNFANAIERTTGWNVFISDQDDVWYPEKIATVMRAFKRDQKLLSVVNDQVIADGHGRETGSTVLRNVRALGKEDAWFGPGCCTAFRRSVLPLLQPFPGNVVAYDHWINAITAALGARHILDEPLQSYRRHDTNASGSVFTHRSPDTFALIRASFADRGDGAIARKAMEIAAIRERLTSRTSQVAALAPDGIASALAGMEHEYAIYASRAALLRQTLPRRMFSSLRLLSRGDYRQFSGLRTALKDIAGF